jgi:hypothetical protein
MSRFDALPADQKAVLQLLLRQGKGYDDLAELLRMEPAAVRTRAYDALDALGPGAAGLHSERRRTIADWLLGQQAPEDAAATRAYLEGSSAGRAWARAVADQLEPIGGDRVPAVPGEAPGAAAGAEAAAAPEPEPPAGTEAPAPFAPAPSAAPRVSRRGGAILIGGVLAVIAAIVLVVVLADGGAGNGADSDTTAAGATGTTTQAQPIVKAQANLLPPEGAPAKRALGVVQVVDVNGQQAINAVVQGLPPTSKAGYGIWLYSNPGRQKWLGYFQSADQQGRAIAQGALPDDVSRYREMLVTRESGRDPPQPGTVFLRGPIGPPPATNGGAATSTGTGG